MYANNSEELVGDRVNTKNAKVPKGKTMSQVWQSGLWLVHWVSPYAQSRTPPNVAHWAWFLLTPNSGIQDRPTHEGRNNKVTIYIYICLIPAGFLSCQYSLNSMTKSRRSCRTKVARLIVSNTHSCHGPLMKNSFESCESKELIISFAGSRPLEVCVSPKPQTKLWLSASDA